MIKYADSQHLELKDFAKKTEFSATAFISLCLPKPAIYIVGKFATMKQGNNSLQLIFHREGFAVMFFDTLPLNNY